MTDWKATSVRQADADTLARALRATRERTLGLIAAWQRARPDLRVPRVAELNPPLWELGHVGWFQEWWIARNRQRARGRSCDPEHPREASRLPGADALYNSSVVAHASRWDLPLPDLDATRRYLELVLADTLALLDGAGSDDDALYFWRLVLLHELGPWALPEALRAKARVIRQSTTARAPQVKTGRHLRALMVGHLRCATSRGSGSTTWGRRWTRRWAGPPGRPGGIVPSTAGWARSRTRPPGGASSGHTCWCMPAASRVAPTW